MAKQTAVTQATGDAEDGGKEVFLPPFSPGTRLRLGHPPDGYAVFVLPDCFHIRLIFPDAGRKKAGVRRTKSRTYIAFSLPGIPAVKNAFLGGHIPEKHPWDTSPGCIPWTVFCRRGMSARKKTAFKQSRNPAVLFFSHEKKRTGPVKVF